MLRDAFNNALGLVGNFINSITGGLATLRDHFTHSPAGTSQTRAAQFVASHRSPVDVSVRATAPGVPSSASFGTDGFKLNATPPADEGSVMLDVTVSNPFASPGPQWSLGGDFPAGEGLEGGFAANFSGSQISGYTGSIGFGFGSGEGASKGPPLDLSILIFPIQF
jgi:hypothetical protein